MLLKLSEISQKTPEAEQKLICVVCGKPTLYICSQCNSAYYCSEDHQRQDRARHNQECKQIAFSKNITDLHGIDPTRILEHKRLYVTRNKARREAVKTFFSKSPALALPYVDKCKLISADLMKNEPTLQFFLIEYVLDCLFEVRVSDVGAAVPLHE